MKKIVSLIVLLVVLFTALNTTDVLNAQPGIPVSPEFRMMQQRAQEEEQQRATFVAVGVGLIILGIAYGILYLHEKTR